MTLQACMVLSVILATRILADDIVVETDIGTIVGTLGSVYLNNTEYIIKEFLGIPYAEPPTGELRFRRAVKKSDFAEPFVAKTLPPFCPQNPAYLEFFGISLPLEVQNEDCLRLNIFTPLNDAVDSEKRAVMVWVHGGYFEVETQNWYLAKLLVATQDVIYVTLNYRLSVLGFLSTGDHILPGNNGLWDQHLAIQWVHDNIEKFGGDPEKVTIAGESAGSAAVIHHALYRNSQGLFQRVIAQSGSANNLFLLEDNPLEKFRIFAEKTNCTKGTHEETIQCLQNKPAFTLMEQLTLDLTFPPVVDGEFVEMHPQKVFLNKRGQSSQILGIYGTYDIMFGLNSDEGALYLSSMDELVSDGSGDPVTGYTLQAFKSKIIPFVLRTTKYPDTPAIRKAIVEFYIDKSDSGNNALIRFSSINLMSDTLFNAGVIQATAAHSGNGTNLDGRTYLYVFDHRSLISIPGITGASHAEEVIFALGFPLDQLLFFYGIDILDPAEMFTEEDIQLGLDMMQYWGNFVKTGNPNVGTHGPSSLTTWPEYDLSSQRYIRFKGGLVAFPIESQYIAERMHFWNTVVPLIYKTCHADCQGNRLKKTSTKEVRQNNPQYKAILAHWIVLIALLGVM